MKLTPKLLGCLALPVAMVVAGGWLHVRRTGELLRGSILDSAGAQANAAVLAVDQALVQYARQWRGFTEGPAVHLALRNAHERYPDTFDPEAWIDAVDAAWNDPSSELAAHARNASLRHHISREMRAGADITDHTGSNDLFGEVILTDARGANLAQTGPTSDFRQSDEDWWRIARERGVHLGGVAWDDSLQDHAVPLSLRADSSDGEFLGVIKVALRASAIVQLTETFVAPSARRAAMRILLVTGDGSILTATPLDERDEAEWLKPLLARAAETPAGQPVHMTLRDDQSDRIVVAAGHGILGGLDRWTVIVEHDASTVFAPVASLARRSTLALVAAGLLLFLAPAAATCSVVRRIHALQKVTVRIASGETGVSVRLAGNDEIAALGRSFDRMALKLDIIDKQRRDYMATLESRNDAIRAEMQARKRIEAQLVQAQKLESIGQLAAGIAHEINTPMQYVADNTRFLHDAFSDVLKVIDACAADARRRASSADGSDAQLPADDPIVNACDLAFLREEIPVALKQSIEGLDHISSIVRAMKNFSHPGSQAKEPADLNAAIQSTVVVCRHRWKYVADVSLDLDPDLPNVPCHIGEINQVILNLLVNAADAIGDVVKDAPDRKGAIRITTRADEDHVTIQVADSGGGIPEEIQTRIFDPFFTTKGVGKGTGQGLAICHNTIVVRHAGAISFVSEKGVGTTFTVRLPIHNPTQSHADHRSAA